MDAVPVKVRHVSEHGWVRAPQHDCPGGVAWELPSGEMMMLPHGRRPEIATFDAGTLV